MDDLNDSVAGNGHAVVQPFQDTIEHTGVMIIGGVKSDLVCGRTQRELSLRADDERPVPAAV